MQTKKEMKYTKDDLRPFIDKINKITENLKKELPTENYIYEYSLDKTGFPEFDGLSKVKVTFIKCNEILKKLQEIENLDFNENNETLYKNLESKMQEMLRLNNIHRDVNFNKITKKILEFLGFFKSRTRTTSTLELNKFAVKLRQGLFGNNKNIKKIGKLIHKVTHDQQIEIGTNELNGNYSPLKLG